MAARFDGREVLFGFLLYFVLNKRLCLSEVILKCKINVYLWRLHVVSIAASSNKTIFWIFLKRFLQLLQIRKLSTVKPRLSNASVLNQISFRPKNYGSDFEHKFVSRPNRKKPSEHERAMMLHISAFSHNFWCNWAVVFFFFLLFH